MTAEIYFMINLHESMGPGRDQTTNPDQTDPVANTMNPDKTAI